MGINFFKREMSTLFFFVWLAFATNTNYKKSKSNRKKHTQTNAVKTKENLCNFVVALKNSLIYNLWTRQLKWKQGEYFRNVHSFSGEVFLQRSTLCYKDFGFDDSFFNELNYDGIFICMLLMMNFRLLFGMKREKKRLKGQNSMGY